MRDPCWSSTVPQQWGREGRRRRRGLVSRSWAEDESDGRRRGESEGLCRQGKTNRVVKVVWEMVMAMVVRLVVVVVVVVVVCLTLTA